MKYYSFAHSFIHRFITYGMSTLHKAWVVRY